MSDTFCKSGSFGDIVEKEGGLPIFDTYILNIIFLPTAEVAARLMGKVGTNLPAEERLKDLQYPLVIELS